MRYRLVVKYLGGVLLVLGAELLATAAVSFGFGEGFLMYLAVSVIAAAVGWALYARVPEREVSGPEAAAVASLSFLLASAVGALPFVWYAGMPWLDAWFESMSGFTTTGFSLMDAAHSPRSILFHRALSQWLGGMGFVVLTIGTLLVTGRSAVTFMKEGAGERMFPRMVRHVRLVAATYAAITALGVLLFMLAGLGPFDALCYSFSGVSTGGFATHAGSVGEAVGHGALKLLPFMLIMALGAVNFVLYYQSWRTHPSPARAASAFFKSPQVVALLVFIVIGGVAVSLTLDGEGRWADGFFMAVSAQTTTGYSTISPSALPDITLIILTAAMFVGGSVGSTAGGVKLYRFMELFRRLNGYVLSGARPRDFVAVRVAWKEGTLAVYFIPFIYVTVIFACTAVFVMAGFDPTRSLFEVTSAAGTVGLSSGIVSPGLDGGLKALLILLMWGGRLEFIPILIWLYSSAGMRAS